MQKQKNYKKIKLCADDYALNPACSNGILELLNTNRLSSVSCMTLSPCWKDYADLLKEFYPVIEIGLHLDFTCFYKYARPIKSIILKSHLRVLNKKLIEENIEIQLNNFVSSMGFLPDFIDGHEHVQILPQVREILIKIYLKYLQSSKPYIRLPLASEAGNIKSNIIEILGTESLRKKLKKNNIPYNTEFYGVYTFTPQLAISEQVKRYRIQMKKWLTLVKQNALLMCHPGNDSNEFTQDGIQPCRVAEKLYLMSQDFLVDLEQAGVIMETKQDNI